MIVRVIKLAVSLSVACFDEIRKAAFVLLGKDAQPIVIVIYYHAVRAEVSSRFSRQMDLLKALTVPIDFDDKSTFEGGVRYSAVTFDDAFMSVVENALPVLRARQIPCTIFVPSSSLGRQPIWIRPPHPDAAEIVAPPEVIREIASDSLVRIGSHSKSHPDFTLLGDDEAREELRGSKEVLESLTGQPVRAFSFPHGAHTSRSVELARECGYQEIHMIHPTPVRDAGRGGVIGRVSVDPIDWQIEFRLKAVGAYRWLVTASVIKRKLKALLRTSSTRASSLARV